jgi:iron-sulfur cluster repair protein YtfE (RIC family)
VAGFADSDSLERWWHEHSELAELVQGVEKTLARGSLERTSQALEDLEAVLDAHFTVEESVYFPVVEKLSPKHQSVIRSAREGHVKISELLDELRDLVERGEIAAAGRTLGHLLDRFRVHEAQEVKLIEDLETLEVGSGD